MPLVRRTSDDPLHIDGRPIEATVGDYWEWSASDLLSNVQRGVFAEYVVELAVGGVSGVRTEWNTYDVVAASGTRIEVRSASYLQAWAQDKHSPIVFDIAPKRAWHADMDSSDITPGRNSDVYVFAVLAHKDQATVDPLNLSQWEFYVLGTSVLEREIPDQKSISLGALDRLHPHRCDFTFISMAIKFAMETQGRTP